MLAFWLISRRELGLAGCYRRSVIAELFYNALINLDRLEKLDRFLSARVQWILSAADPHTVGEEAPPPLDGRPASSKDLRLREGEGRWTPDSTPLHS